MLKLPIWMLEQLARAGKNLNPSDVLNQSNLDDLLHIAHQLLGR